MATGYAVYAETLRGEWVPIAYFSDEQSAYDHSHALNMVSGIDTDDTEETDRAFTIEPFDLGLYELDTDFGEDD